MPSSLPIAVVRRLPRYFRHLTELAAASVLRISSGELAARMEITASQVRQDFSCFGGQGQQGLGYSIPVLLRRVGDLLGLHDGHTAILLGIGNIGRALLNNFSFESHGFVLTGTFDTDPAIIGWEINGHLIRHIDGLAKFCAPRPPDIAVLSVPGRHAAAVAESCAILGIRGFWNFSNVEIKIPGTTVENVYFGDSLMTLCYRIKE